MKKWALIASFAMLSLISIPGCDDDDDNVLDGPEFKAFNEDMRELWTDHVLWTRNVIINIIDDAPGTTEAVNRLLQNQDDIGDAIRPYYGDAGGDGLTALLREHITIAADLLTAAKAGNNAAVATASTAWYANADEIAAFLNTANPEFFPLDHMKTMMKEHLDLTLSEATARLNGNYAADVAAFDLISEQILEMADMLAEGIANQFPDQF